MRLSHTVRIRGMTILRAADAWAELRQTVTASGVRQSLPRPVKRVSSAFKVPLIKCLSLSLSLSLSRSLSRSLSLALSLALSLVSPHPRLRVYLVRASRLLVTPPHLSLSHNHSLWRASCCCRRRRRLLLLLLLLLVVVLVLLVLPLHHHLSSLPRSQRPLGTEHALQRDQGWSVTNLRDIICRPPQQDLPPMLAHARQVLGIGTRNKAQFESKASIFGHPVAHMHTPSGMHCFPPAIPRAHWRIALQWHFSDHSTEPRSRATERAWCALIRAQASTGGPK